MTKHPEPPLRLIGEPSEEQLAKIPGLQALVSALREAALAWAERRPAPAVAVAFSERMPRGELVQWDAATLLAHALLDGAEVPALPNTPVVRMALGYTRTIAGRRLAELAVAATGLQPAAIAEAALIDVGADESVPPAEPVGRVLAWLTEHVGEALAGHVVETLGFYVFTSFDRLGRLAAEQRATEAEQRAETAEREKKLAEKWPTLRRGVAFSRTLLNTAAQVRKRGDSAAMQRGKMDADALELRKEFRYDPLGIYERLAMHSLVSIAREAGALDAHPWATASGAMPVKAPGEDPPRVRVLFPGASEVARIAGHAPGRDGRMSSDIRGAYQRAIGSLINTPRWIAVDVLYPPEKRGGEWVPDVEIRKDLWVRLGASVKLRHGAFLDVHPAAVASHLRAFEDIPDLGAVYEAARESMGLKQLRDDFAICDDYLRYLALSIVPGVKRRQERGLVIATPGMAVGDETITKRLAHATILARLGLEGWAKKQGQRASIARVREALTFCQHIGTVRPGFDIADGIWSVELPHPAGAHADPDQLLVLTDELASHE